MKVITIIIPIILALSGCGSIKRMYTSWTGSLTYKCAKTGVEYVQSDSGLTLLVTDEGRPVKCSAEL